MKVTIIGTGYVGLSTAAVLSFLGNQITCVDVNQKRLEMLAAGGCPFYEPHLEEILAMGRRNLRFTSNYAEAIPNADVIFITVGTPPTPDGSPDLSYLRSAAHSIGQHLGTKFTVVVNKSTVPIGSGNWVESLIHQSYVARVDKNGEHFAVTSNPEFLREGSALYDSLYPDRIVVGTTNSQAFEVLYKLYQPILEQSFLPPPFLPRPEGVNSAPIVRADLASAELIKYAANSFLSLKISFINEIASLAECVGADVAQIARGIGLDSRIGHRFLQAGLGWGGSCFGKDTAALISTAAEYHLSMPIISAARDVNKRQREKVVEKLATEFKILKGRTFGLLGLAFKPNTDDMRDAPAVDIARLLLLRGAHVRVHDPVAMEAARREMADMAVDFCDDPAKMAEDCDAVIVVTEWPEYKQMDWAAMAPTMKTPIVLDGRLLLEPDEMQSAGMKLIGFGR
jgi:UDPglucose 6-dehydrogenase